MIAKTSALDVECLVLGWEPFEVSGVAFPSAPKSTAPEVRDFGPLRAFTSRSKILESSISGLPR